MALVVAKPRIHVMTPPPAQPPKVLVIDDDPELLHSLELRFRNFELQMLAAYHGMHGIWLATIEKPDLIITDVRMPQGEGSYVMQCLSQRADTSAIPVIVLTGVRNLALQARLLQMGAVKVFHKPVAFDVLLNEISKHIGLREQV
jgi:DNA-binding response OmpR family regulator